MTSTNSLRMELNGAPVQAEHLRVPLFSNYGHFTVLPVKNGRVRGLPLHLDRLRQNTQILFGCDLDPSRVLTYVRHAIRSLHHELLSVRVDIFSGMAVSEPTRRVEEPDILVTVRAMTPEPLSPLRIASVQYQRDLPQVKHAGTFGLNYHYRQAQLNGFDDALFTDAMGLISEGTGWNIGFFDGSKIIWPKAPVLPGISMQLIQSGLRESGIPFEVRGVWLRDLPTFRSAFITDVLVGAQPIASIDDVDFSVDSGFNAMLTNCYEMNPEVEI